MQRGLKSDLGSKTVVQFVGELRFFGKNLKELLSDTNQKYIEKVKIVNTRVRGAETNAHQAMRKRTGDYSNNNSNNKKKTNNSNKNNNSNNNSSSNNNNNNKNNNNNRAGPQISVAYRNSVAYRLLRYRNSVSWSALPIYQNFGEILID